MPRNIIVKVHAVLKTFQPRLLSKKVLRVYLLTSSVTNNFWFCDFPGCFAYFGGLDTEFQCL